MRIKLISCEQETYIIEPVKDTNKIFLGSPKDLSVELVKLKDELRSRFALIENQDYIVDRGPYPNTDPYYHIKFSGKSQVLRALFSLPAEDIDFSKAYPPTSKENFDAKRTRFAMNISDRECSVSEAPVVETVHNNLLNALIREINLAHKEKSSPVIDQLNKDLLQINSASRKNDLWGKSNFQLSCAALYHAYLTEKAKPTILEGSLSFFGSGTAVLSNSYQKIFDNYCSYLGRCEGYQPNFYGEGKFNFLEKTYYPAVKSLDPGPLSSIISHELR